MSTKLDINQHCLHPQQVKAAPLYTLDLDMWASVWQIGGVLSPVDGARVKVNP